MPAEQEISGVSSSLNLLSADIKGPGSNPIF
jgi:hypothetical protein